MWQRTKLEFAHLSWFIDIFIVSRAAYWRILCMIDDACKIQPLSLPWFANVSCPLSSSHHLWDRCYLWNARQEWLSIIGTKHLYKNYNELYIYIITSYITPFNALTYPTSCGSIDAWFFSPWRFFSDPPKKSGKALPASCAHWSAASWWRHWTPHLGKDRNRLNWCA